MIHAVPITTASWDCALLGQRRRNHIPAITMQHTVMATAESRRGKVRASAALTISTSGMGPRQKVTPAINRHVFVCISRAARNAVSQ